mmetsp:Transcript_10608/g.43963  ORF Transcript_10608/g.43963 Transcript_10608/m.43963 type:complete len:233 (-) Transcript_10608:94-792(-)
MAREASGSEGDSANARMAASKVSVSTYPRRSTRKSWVSLAMTAASASAVESREMSPNIALGIGTSSSRGSVEADEFVELATSPVRLRPAAAQSSRDSSSTRSLKSFHVFELTSMMPSSANIFDRYVLLTERSLPSTRSDIRSTGMKISSVVASADLLLTSHCLWRSTPSCRNPSRTPRSLATSRPPPGSDGSARILALHFRGLVKRVKLRRQRGQNGTSVFRTHRFASSPSA